MAQDYSRKVKSIVKDAVKLEKAGGSVKLIADKYVLAAELQPTDPGVNFQAGKYLLSTTNRHRALRYLKRVEQLEPDFDEYLDFYLGMAYKHNRQFVNAIHAFDKIVREDGSVPDLVARNIEECEAGIRLLDQPTDYEVWNAGVNINSPYPDYAPSVDASGNLMVFTSRRFGDQNNQELFSDGLPYEEIYFTESSAGGSWQRAANIGNPVNSGLHDSNLALSPDGRTMLSYSGLNQGDVLISRYDSARGWSRPVSMKWVNSRSAEKSACFGYSEDQIFFSSDRPGSVGQLDIFYIFKNERGYWERPINLGEVINTPGIEDAPFFDPATATLYFSSNGHVGIGGFDIWRSTYDSTDQTWTKPVNVGLPINSTADDLYFTKDDHSVYFTSDRGDGLGESDIYIGKRLRREVRDTPALLTFFIRDQNDSSLLDAELVVKETSSANLVTTEASGRGVFRINREMVGDSVTLSVESDGYMYRIEDYELDANLTEITIFMQVIDPEETYTLKHIFFSFNSSELDPVSYFEIDKLEYFLTINPTLGILIQGHTDEVGDESYNQNLSEQRSASVAEALVLRGIEPGRIKTFGYGESQPLSDNADENRRVEFSVYTLEGY